jgi:hypothetical protein
MLYGDPGDYQPRPGQPARPYTPPPMPGGVAPQPQGGGLPNAGIYAQKQALAEQAYQQAIAQINQKKSRTLRDYGFLESGQVDPNNQYGAYQMMSRNQAQAADTTEMQARSRGFAGVGGLAGRRLSNLNFEHGAERYKMQAGYSDALEDIANLQNTALWDRDQAMLNITQEQLQEALQQQNFTPAALAEEAALPTRAAARAGVAKTVKKVLKKKKKKGK